ncbi:hypothetical protein KI387_031928, partial [Taxus chinensis]
AADVAGGLRSGRLSSLPSFVHLYYSAVELFYLFIPLHRLGIDAHQFVSFTGCLCIKKMCLLL